MTDDTLSLLSESGDLREDLRPPEHPVGYAAQLQTNWEQAQLEDKRFVTVTVTRACGLEQVTNHRIEDEEA